jgi:hypothetical protein
MIRQTIGLCALVALASGSIAGAQSFSTDGNATPGSTVHPIERVIGATSITQSTNAATITAAASVSCNGGAPGFLHTDNSYFRAFTLSAFNPPLDQLQFLVQSITFGIETANASGTGTTQPITVRVFTSSANPPTNATLSAALSTETVNVPDQTNSLFTVNLTTQPVLLTASDILVVEVFTPNGQVAGHSFFIGSNALGQSGPSFIRAAPCGLADIGNLAGIGFPNMHLVMTVNGNSQMPVSLETFSID